MTLNATTLENIRTANVTLTYPSARLGELVEANTPSNLYREDRNSQALLITRFDTGHVERAVRSGVGDWVGSVRMVGPSYSNHDGWLLYSPGGEIVRAYGAPLNPEPINGSHYRLLSGNHNGYLLRYNDDEHAADRGSRNLPWTILHTGFEGDAPIFADGFSNHTITNPYVEVNYTPGAAAPWADPVEATVGIPTTMASSNRRLHGLAVAVNGVVTMNPEPVLGQMYLLLPKSSVEDYTRVAMWVQGGFAVSGYIDGYGDFTRDRGNLLAQPDHWDYVLMELHEPIRLTNPQVLLNHKRALHDEKVLYHSWQERLNELAEEHDWCGEYESAVHRCGVMNRDLRRDDPVPPVPDIDENGDEIEVEPPIMRRLWNFEVSWNATMELDSPESRVDDALSRNIGVDIEASSMRFEASGSVTVGPIAIEGNHTSEDSEREARDQIDSSMVEEAINANLSDADLIEVTNFDTERDGDDVTDNYDLEDYFDF